MRTYGVMAIGLALMLAALWGMRLQHLKQANVRGAEVQAARLLEHQQHQVTAKVDAAVTARAEHGKLIDQAINREVTHYVATNASAGACQLDVDWVRLHNAAATGSLPEPTGAVDGGAAPVGNPG